MIPSVIVAFVNIFVPIFSAVLLLRIILSYVMKPGSRFMDAMMGMTEPVLAPIRKILPPTGGLDFSPLVALLLLQALQSVINSFINV
jgi:YggT family protein